MDELVTRAISFACILWCLSSSTLVLALISAFCNLQIHGESERFHEMPIFRADQSIPKLAPTNTGRLEEKDVGLRRPVWCS